MHFIALALSAVVASGLPTNLNSQDSDIGHVSGVAHFSLSRPTLKERIRLSRRSSDVDVQILDKSSAFTATLNVGSNNQKVEVLVDTGSSDLWLMSSHNPFCTSGRTSRSNALAGRDYLSLIESQPAGDTINCSSSTQFDQQASTSFTSNTTAFSLTYGDGSFANGTYAQDTISYGSITLKNANFAVADTSNSTSSVWGIGLVGLEAIAHTYDSSGNFFPTYPNLPVQMKQQGIIGTVAYSLWLNDVDASSGSLLFGGVDHAKYDGSLQTLPLLSNYPGAKPNEMLVKLDKISLYQGSNSADIVTCEVSALLDSGTTYMILPGPFVEVILNSIGGEYTDNGCLVPCGLAGGLKFDFSGAQINVPFSEMTFSTGLNDVCLLGILPANTFILGDTFLRSAYVVYDLENYEVALANAKYNITTSSIEAITNGIPGATQAPGYSSTSFTSTYSTQAATFFTVGAGSTVSNSKTQSRSRFSDATSSNAALGTMTQFLTSSTNSQFSQISSAGPASVSTGLTSSTRPSNRKNGAVPSKGYISKNTIALSGLLFGSIGLLLLL